MHIIIKLLIFSYPTVLTYAFGAQKNSLFETEETVVLKPTTDVLVENKKIKFSLRARN